MKKEMLRAAFMLLLMTFMCGIFYQGAVTAAAHLFFPEKANGSIIEIEGRRYGSRLLAQHTAAEDRMWGRVMHLTYLEDGSGQKRLYGLPSNLGPGDIRLQQIIEKRIRLIQKAHPQRAGQEIPSELVTCSGSGLDPEISLEAAIFQAPRLAAAAGISEEEMRRIIYACRSPRFFGILGEETVNVLEVNLILEGVLPWD